MSLETLVKREDLLKPLQAINSVVEKKQASSILSNVLLATSPNQLRLTGTDHEIEVVGFVPVDPLTQVGETTVSARKLFDICRALPERAMISLMQTGNNLHVKAHGSCFKLNTLPPDDFKSLEEENYHTQSRIKQAHLQQLLTKTYFAMAQQDVRHYLNGVCIDITPHAITCIAMDGHRLALATSTDGMAEAVSARVILPRKSVLELMRLLEKEAEEAQIEIGDNRLKVTTPDFIFTSKLIHASYPDYHRLIQKGSFVVTGNRDTIKQALARAAILSSEKLRGVRVQLAAGQLIVTANNTDQEQAEEIVPVAYDGEPLEIGFNVLYLLDALASLTSETIRCYFHGPDAGLLIESAEESGALYLIMPMRL